MDPGRGQKALLSDVSSISPKASGRLGEDLRPVGVRDGSSRGLWYSASLYSPGVCSGDLTPEPWPI